MAKGAGGVLHLASTAFCPGFCQACWLLPRGTEDAGLCAESVPTRPQNKTARTIRDFIEVTADSKPMDTSRPTNETVIRIKIATFGLDP